MTGARWPNQRRPASSSSRTASTGSRRRKRRWGSRCGRRCRPALTMGPEPVGREAQVLERIEGVRRRRPRLTDDVVTMAHGAGGKASAALVDAVFLEAFGNLGPLADAASVLLPSGERLAFTTDSFVVRPLRFPGGSIGHLAVHGTVNDLAVVGARP